MNMPSFIYKNYKELAELRAFRLSGYAEMKACTATNAQILEIEEELARFVFGGGEIDWSRRNQPRIVETVVTRLLSFMT